MEQYYEAIDLLKGMISRPSFSREETAVADYLQKCWSDAGHHLFRKGNNLWIIAPGFDFAKPTLLLNSHIDTVKPAAGWQKDPFLPEETEDDRLYGLGSNDAGASVVSLYEAFTILSAKAQPYNLIFLASCEEEVSGKNGIESVLPELPPIRFDGRARHRDAIVSARLPAERVVGVCRVHTRERFGFRLDVVGMLSLVGRRNGRAVDPARSRAAEVLLRAHESGDVARASRQKDRQESECRVKGLLFDSLHGSYLNLYVFLSHRERLRPSSAARRVRSC